MTDFGSARSAASTREEKDEQLLLLNGLLATMRHFFGGFSPSVEGDY